MAIRHHFFRHVQVSNVAWFNKHLKPGDFHIFSTSRIINGAPEVCKEVFNKCNMDLVYQSPECFSGNHPERTYPSLTLWIFKTREKEGAETALTAS